MTAVVPIWRGRVGGASALLLVVVSALAFAAMRAMGTQGPAGVRWLLPGRRAGTQARWRARV